MYIELNNSPIAWNVQTLDWDEHGGPRQAALHSAPNPNWQFLPELLGQAVCIYAAQGRPAWWGYVNQVQANLGRVQLRWQLNEIANRTARLLPVQSAAPFANSWQHTPWQDEPLSQARFGVRERLLPPDSGTPPTWPQVQFAANGAAPGLRLIGRGWAETLNWRTCDPLELRSEFIQPGGELQTLQNNLAQAFLVQSSALVTAVWLRAAARAATGPLLWALCADEGTGSPGIPLAQGSLAADDIGSTMTWRRIELSEPLPLNAGQPLWLWLGGGPPWSVELNEAALAATGPLLQQLSDGTWAVRLPIAQLLFSLETAWNAARLLDRIGSLGGQFLSGWQAEINPNLRFSPPMHFLTCGEALQQLCALADAQALITPERVLRLLPRPAGEERLLGEDGLVRAQTGRLLALDESLAGHPLRLWQSHGPQTNCPAARWRAGELTAKPIFTKL